MLVIPAIDLQNGNCVRLEQGDTSNPSLYSDDPAATARRWIDQGAKRLHVVDLDGAVAGEPVNRTQISRIIEAAGRDAVVQIGGGIRNIAEVENKIDAGASYVVLGTAAIENPAFLRDACNEFGEHIILALDAKEGNLATRGWKRTVGKSLDEFIKTLSDHALSAVICTDIGRDGMLSGVNEEEILRLTEICDHPIIASGGVGSIDDIMKLHKHRKSGIAGVIVGRAIYTGDVDLAEAIDRTERAD